MWLFVVVLVIALMIPITAILLDSPLGRSLARRLEGQTDGGSGRGKEVRELERRPRHRVAAAPARRPAADIGEGGRDGVLNARD